MRPQSFTAVLSSVSPAVVVLTVATMVVLVVVVGGYVARGGFWSPRLDVRVQSDDFRFDASRAENLQRPWRSPFTGEVYFTAERLREGTALAYVLSLRAARLSLSQRPPGSVAELLAIVEEADLIPPGLTIASNKTILLSALGTYHIRYRPLPLAVEVVSVPLQPAGGPVLLVRVPDEEHVVETARPQVTSYYASLRLEGVTIPAPFAPVSEVIAAGFKAEVYQVPVHPSAPPL